MHLPPDHAPEWPDRGGRRRGEGGVMGEIAEMMLEGLLCEGCGDFIDEDGDEGIPRYCSPECAAGRGMKYTPPKKRSRKIKPR